MIGVKTEHTIQAEAEQRRAEENARRLAAVCPDQATKIIAAERKATEAAQAAEALRTGKDDAVSSLMLAIVARGRTLQYASEIRALTEVDLQELGESAALALLDAKRSPCPRADSIYENTTNYLIRLSALRPFLQKLLATEVANASAQLEEIKATAKRESISLPMLLEVLHRESGLSEDKKTNLNPEVLGLINNGFLALE